jgi:hypothetical protein
VIDASSTTVLPSDPIPRFGWSRAACYRSEERG